MIHKFKILLCLTGSVASTLYYKLIQDLSALGEVNVVISNKGLKFVNLLKLEVDVAKFSGGSVFTDREEWASPLDTVKHMELVNESSILVIAPCSANTLSKIANGMCDNLVTTIVRAWDRRRPIILAPAMNTNMWEHPLTYQHIKIFEKFSFYNYTLDPQVKTLMCGTHGCGAMCEIHHIVDQIRRTLRWSFPIHKCVGVPSHGHPGGSFAVQRSHGRHTGVDLYTHDGCPVYAVEQGRVIHMGPFTGPKDNSPWWNDTDCILVEGPSGVVCYGEVSVNHGTIVGAEIRKNQHIGHVKRVLKEGKERPDINGHSTSMLHLELYPRSRRIPSDGFDEAILYDPTPLLLAAECSPGVLLAKPYEIS